MEKISYAPLIKHLQEEAETYNQLLREYELKHGHLDPVTISSWVTDLMEPVLKEVTKDNPEKTPQVFKSMFREMLVLQASGAGIEFKNEFFATWTLLCKTPFLASLYPARIIRAINSALHNLRMHYPEKVKDWIQYLNSTIEICKTTDEIFSSGRIYAWICGMAHLRTKSLAELSLLPIELKTAIVNSASINMEVIQNPWPGREGPGFEGEAGGFTGFGGHFTAPPLLALVEDQILVTDGEVTCAFFADSYGKILLPEIPVLPQLVVKRSVKENLKQLISTKLIPFDDVSSCVIKDNTCIITRGSSHYLYVYSI